MKRSKAVQVMQVFFDLMTFTVIAVDLRTDRIRSRQELDLLVRQQLTQIEHEVRADKRTGDIGDLLAIEMKVIEWCKIFNESN
jgi:hypothetical protein